MFDLYRIPSGTREITYTDAEGNQREIPVEERSGGYAYAAPASQADVDVLEGFGYTHVARKAMDERSDSLSPDAGRPEEPTTDDTSGPDTLAGEEG